MECSLFRAIPVYLSNLVSLLNFTLRFFFLRLFLEVTNEKKDDPKGRFSLNNVFCTYYHIYHLNLSYMKYNSFS